MDRYVGSDIGMDRYFHQTELSVVSFSTFFCQSMDTDLFWKDPWRETSDLDLSPVGSLQGPRSLALGKVNCGLHRAPGLAVCHYGLAPSRGCLHLLICF